MTPALAHASLPWYDLAEVRGLLDALWTLVRANLDPRLVELVAVPERLDRETPVEAQWRSGALLLGQACGYDVAVTERDHLQLVATPCFQAPGCAGAFYRSAVMVRADSGIRRLEDLRGARCAINGRTSHSGMNALRALVGPLQRDGRFFAEVVETGGHEESVARVAARELDVAAIDCVTLDLLRRHRPGALGPLREIAWTRRAPAPPFVTSRALSRPRVDALRAGLRAALAAPEAGVIRRGLGLESVAFLPLRAYRWIADEESHALACGYPMLDGTSSGDAVRSSVNHASHAK